MDKVVEFIKKNKVKVAGALIMIAAFVILAYNQFACGLYIR